MLDSFFNKNKQDGDDIEREIALDAEEDAIQGEQTLSD